MTANGPRLYLLDVEGTVAPVSLVYEQMFPFARAHFPGFLEKNKMDPAVAADLDLLSAESHAEADTTAPRIADVGDLGRTIKYLNWLMDRD